MAKIETVIIGAGPYGLSIAAHLKAADIPFRVYGSPLESWRSYMPDGMLLRSEPFASNLWDPKRKFTLAKYFTENGMVYQPFGRPVMLSTFLEYADWFRRKAVGEVHNLKVIQIQKEDDHFVIELSDGSFVECRHVILATGHMAFRFIPPEIAHLPESHCTHSAQIKDVRKYSGQDVTVIGAGQSALECAALIHEAGAKVRLLIRKDQIKWNAPSTQFHRSLIARIQKPEAGLGSGWKILAISEFPQLFRMLFPAEKRHRFVATSWGPSGAHWLRDRVEDKVDILMNHRLSSAIEKGGGTQLTVEGPHGQKEIHTDVVIAATGFKIDLDRLQLLSPEIRGKMICEGSAPTLDSRFETSIPGLFIVGVASSPTFGPVMRFMFGSKHVGPVLVRRLKSRFAQLPFQSEVSESI